jgi:hypothetical protein
VVEPSSWAVLAGSIWPGRRPTLAPSGSRDTSIRVQVPALVMPGTCTYRSWPSSRVCTARSVFEPVAVRSAVPRPFGASMVPTTFTPEPAVRLTLKLVLPRVAAAVPRADAAAGSAAAELADGAGVPTVEPGAAASSAEQPDTASATAAITPIAGTVTRRVRMSALPAVPASPLTPVDGDSSRWREAANGRAQALTTPSISFGISITSDAGGASTRTSVPKSE